MMILSLNRFNSLWNDKLTCSMGDPLYSYLLLKCKLNVFFIAEFERPAKIRKNAVYRFLISLLVSEL